MTASAIIVCAGNSTRMKGVNKILLPLGNSNVIGNSLMAFEKCPSVKDIVVVCRECDEEQIRKTAEEIGITKLHAFACGGETRQKSVLNGLRKISADTEMIAIHDGARPLVKPEHIEKTIKDASVFGGATLGVPVKDTIKIVHDGLIDDTPHRPSLYITQTPQIFKRRIYFEGVDFAAEHELDFTNDCQLIEAIGTKVYMTVGDYTNIKITTPEDIEIAELLLKREEG
ncbi:MAG: 2-C-methyl-D-erythritol 4-phosphate cytidylyltransferase [Oscillospiraceae bacterium]|nr:2-C-methyl-D-erythritol 4-phosphate cytidylyltransferase [Oscillospiraceae bacterium]